MATFDERFGDLDAFPTDPNERRRLIDAVRSQYLMETTQEKGNRVAREQGFKFKVPPAADWSIEPDAQGEAAANREPSRMVIPELDAAVVGAKNEAPLAEAGPTWAEIKAGLLNKRDAPPPSEPSAPSSSPVDETGFVIANQKPEIPQYEALARGFVHGGSLGFGNKIAAATEASGLPSTRFEMLLPGPVQAMITAARTAAGYGRAAVNKGAASTFERTLREEDKRSEAAKEQHPNTTMIGDVAGSLMLPVPGPVQGAKLLPYAGKLAGISGLYSAGGALGDSRGEASAGDIATSGGVGAATGFALPYAGRLASILGARPLNYLRNVVRPQQGAERAVGVAAQDLERSGAAGAREAITPAQMEANPEAVLMDVLGEPGRQLGRAATNLSGEGLATAQSQLRQRAEDRTTRAVTHIEDRFGPTPSAELKDRLIEEGANTSDPLYQFARRAGNRDLTAGVAGSQGLPRLLERSPSLRTAAAQAEVALRDRAAGAENEWSGVRNLEYWDMVKRKLDDQINRAVTHKDASTAGQLTSVKNALVERLDRQVPGYAEARANSEQFFGSGRAVELGEKLPGRGQDTAMHVANINALSPADKQLAVAGTMDRVKNAASKDPNWWGKFERNVGGIRDKLQGVLNPSDYAELHARSQLEKVYQMSHAAVTGNSSTARQLLQAGTASAAGAGLGYSLGADENNPSGALVGLGAGALGGKAILPQLMAMQDKRMATLISRALMSRDTGMLERVSKAAAQSQKNMRAFQDAINRLTMTGQREATQ